MRGVFGALVAGIEAKSHSGTITGSIEDLWLRAFGRPVKSGVSVTWETALDVSTVYACAGRICEALMVPTKIYRRDPTTGHRSEARDHYLYDVLESAPNQWQSGAEYRETLGLHTCLTGAHYSYKNSVRGEVKELIPLQPQKVTTRQLNDGSLVYRIVHLDGTTDEFGPDEIWHVRGTSWNGAVGMDLVSHAREAIGLALATEETHARFHSNGANPSGIFSTDSKLDDVGIRRLKEQWGATQAGLANRFKVAVLDNGLKWQQVTMSGVDAEHIKTRQFQIEQICQFFKVMPIMVGYSGDKAPTFASAEQMFLQHLVHTVHPWQRRIAASVDRWLLSAEDRRAGYYFAFTFKDFLSPALKDQAEYYKIALGGGGNPGWITPDEVRAFDELPPLPGGDRLYVPMNTVPIGDDGFPRPNAQPTPAKTTGEGDDA
jgi:HK97 family phage portal protein